MAYLLKRKQEANILNDEKKKFRLSFRTKSAKFCVINAMNSTNVTKKAPGSTLV